MRRHAPAFLALAAAGLFAYACGSDNITTPGGSTAGLTAPNAPHKAIIGVSGPVQVRALYRTSPLLAPITVKLEIGGKGGTVTIPEAGLTVYVPDHAVKRERIYITANAGPLVSYEFQPHGLQFVYPVVITQSLANTTAAQTGSLTSNFLGAYVLSSADVSLTTGTATAAELFNTSYDATTNSVSFQVMHFSGYLVASGLEEQQ
jgi:hypothetical protein